MRAYIILRWLLMLGLSATAISCDSINSLFETESEDSGGGNNSPGGSTASGTNGYWRRQDGTFGYFWVNGSTAQFCWSGGLETGSYNSSTGRLIFTVNGNRLEFSVRQINNDVLEIAPITNNQTHDPARYVRTNTTPCHSGSGGGGGGGGGSSTGQVTFWASRDFRCGTITVQVTGQGSRSVTSYYTGGAPSCGASGTATFTLAPGTYNWSASCSGLTWGPSTVTVTAGQCFKMELR